MNNATVEVDVQPTGSDNIISSPKPPIQMDDARVETSVDPKVKKKGGAGTDAPTDCDCGDCSNCACSNT